MPNPTKQNKDTRLQIRITQRDKERLEAYAYAAGKTVSHFVRDDLVLRFLRLEDTKKLDKDLEVLKKKLDKHVIAVPKKKSRVDMTGGLR